MAIFMADHFMTRKVYAKVFPVFRAQVIVRHCTQEAAALLQNLHAFA